VVLEGEGVVQPCTPMLRCKPLIPKSDTMAPYDTIMRGRCEDSAPYLLPARHHRTPGALRHAAL